jgi:hypothetical protein
MTMDSLFMRGNQSINFFSFTFCCELNVQTSISNDAATLFCAIWKWSTSYLITGIQTTSNSVSKSINIWIGVASFLSFRPSSPPLLHTSLKTMKEKLAVWNSRFLCVYVCGCAHLVRHHLNLRFGAAGYFRQKYLLPLVFNHILTNKVALKT